MSDVHEYMDWNEFLLPYEQAMKELTLKFNLIKDQCESQGEYSPILQVQSRLKSPDSILTKLDKNGYSISDISERIKDIAGIRLISRFEEDLIAMRDLIRVRSDLSIVYEKDYLASPKKSGYKSIHIIVRYDVETYRCVETVYCEIQLRTLAMDYWATIEHSLNYKYKNELPSTIERRLVFVSDSISQIDREMGKIRDEIMDAQRLFQIKNKLINSLIDQMHRLSRMGQKDLIKKYYKTFEEIRQSDDTDRLSDLNKEIQQTINQLSH